MMQTMEGATRFTMSDMNGLHAGQAGQQMDSRYRSLKTSQSIPMSKSLPVTRPGVGTPRDGVWRSSQSLTGRASVMTYQHKQYPSASAALSDYISDYDSQTSSQDSQSPPSYRRTVSDLLLPKTSLQKTVKRSLDTGVRDTKDEFHRFNVRKLIDDSYEQILRADLEQGKASAIVATAKHLGTESTMSFEDRATHEKEFSDCASEISSSTDALLLANPYVVTFRHRDRKLHHDGASSLQRSKSIDSARLPVSTSYVRQRHLKTLGRRNDSSQQMHSNRSQFLKDQRPFASSDRTDFLQTSNHGVPSPMHSVYEKRQELRRSVPSRSDRRPIPAWVSDLDNSVTSQKRLDTLYTDTLLGADGHAQSCQESMRQSHRNATSISADLDPRMHTRLAQGQFEERAMSVMSGTRPPPTWVEDLDTTVDSLPGSLRLLGKNIEPNPSTRHRRGPHQDDLTNGYSKSGYHGQQSRELSNPASLRSDIGQPRVTPRHVSSEMRYRNGNVADRNARRGKAALSVNSSKDRIIEHRSHRRTQSASTDDLIKESPYGDAVPASFSQTSQHRHHLLRQSNDRASNIRTSRPSRTTAVKPSPHTNLSSARAIHVPSSSRTKPHLEQPKKTAHLDVSTTTDSLIYSSPFGLDKEMPFPDLSVLPPAYSQSHHHLSPIRSADSNGTLKEEELASSLSSLSSITLETEHLTNGKSTRPPLIADHVSESTVGETARANAMLRRANRIMENTHNSLNTSSLLEQQAHTPESSDTEELLAGDQEFMTRLQTKMQAEEDTPRDPATQKIFDQFLQDCVQSSGKVSPEDSEEQTSEGPLESLKNMLFKLQDMASQHAVESREATKSHQPKQPYSDGRKKTVMKHSGTPHGGTRHLSSSLGTNHPSSSPSSSSSSPSSVHRRAKGATLSPTSQHRIKNVSFQSQRDFEEEPGGKSMQRAMQHLSRLKTLVAVDTSSSSSAARASFR